MGYNERMDRTTQYVRQDEHGVMRVANTHVMLDSLIAAYELGHSPESIRAQYPSLALNEVYGAITWCLEHPAEVEEYMNRQDAIWRNARSGTQANESPVVRRLREAKAVQSQGR